MHTKITMGALVIDSVSGFKGRIVAAHLYLNGCMRYSVQPPVDKEGKLPDSQSFDEPSLKVISDTPIAGKRDTGGPAKYMPRARPE